LFEQLNQKGINSAIQEFSKGRSWSEAIAVRSLVPPNINSEPVVEGCIANPFRLTADIVFEYKNPKSKIQN
jgi:hypothetical protein